MNGLLLLWRGFSAKGYYRHFFSPFQLKPDPGQVGGFVTHSVGQQEQQVFMTVDSRFGSPGGDRMVPTQVPT